MNSSTALSFMSLPYGEQLIVQNESFTHFFIIKHADSLYDNFLIKLHRLLLQKHFNFFSEMGMHLKNRSLAICWLRYLKPNNKKFS